MADKQPAPKKRLVKNPETFRERALKAGEEAGKPKRSARLRQMGGQVISPVTAPVGTAAGKAGQLKPFRVLGKILRVIGKIILPKYFRESWHELKQVNWPTWKESRQLTFAVLVFAVAFGIAIAIVDFGLDKLFKDVLLK